MLLQPIDFSVFNKHIYFVNTSFGHKYTYTVKILCYKKIHLIFLLRITDKEENSQDTIMITRNSRDYSHKQYFHKDKLYFVQYTTFAVLNDYRLRKTVT